MFRRSVSFLVIAGLLASQLVSTAHAHGAATLEQQREHNATPHFHCHLHDHGNHSHGEFHVEGRHQHAVPSQVQQKSASVDTNGLLRSDGDDHDGDAIYVPHADALKPSTATGQAPCPFAAQSVTPSAFCACAPWSGPHLSPYLHPPDEVLDASETFLTLRNLRL